MRQRPKFPAYTPRAAGAPNALEGIRVADFTRMLAGPYCTQQLVDLGAEVIKIEAPGTGDDARNYTATALDGESALYLSTNRNKKSIVLDLKNESGAAIARDIIAQSDVLVENFSTGIMKRFGLDYETVREINPKIIYCAISGYGLDDDAETPRRGYDAMFQASSGFMSLTGPAESPYRTTVPIADIASGMFAASAVLGALIARGRTGEGQFIEVALFDAAANLLTLYGMSYLISGEDTPRYGNRSAQTAPSDVYQASDGPIFITCGNQRLFRRLCVEALDREDLFDDPRYASNFDRVRNIEPLTATLNEAFSKQTRQHWVDLLTRLGIPVTAIATVSEALTSGDAVRRNLIASIPHPRSGDVPTIRSAMRLSGTPVVDPVAPPVLNAQAEEVLLGMLGYDESRVEQLRAAGAFGQL